MAILHFDVVRETTVLHSQMYQRLRNQPLGVTPNLENGNASAYVSVNDNDNDECIEGVSDERQTTKKSRGKKKEKFSRRSFTFEETED